MSKPTRSVDVICNKKNCFANQDGKCKALTEHCRDKKGKLKFYKTKAEVESYGKE